jgi:hypothetical protein
MTLVDFYGPICGAFPGVPSVCESVTSETDPRTFYLCNLEPPPFNELPQYYQELLAAEDCFLNETYAPAPQALSPWCACSAPGFNPGGNVLAVLNFYVGVNVSTGAVSPPANLTAPDTCASAPFVPFKDLYLCDVTGLPGGTCRADDTRFRPCPSDKPVGLWNETFDTLLTPQEQTQCRELAVDALKLTGDDGTRTNETLCLPADGGGVCQVQNCPCGVQVSAMQLLQLNLNLNLNLNFWA